MTYLLQIRKKMLNTRMVLIVKFKRNERRWYFVFTVSIKFLLIQLQDRHMENMATVDGCEATSTH